MAGPEALPDLPAQRLSVPWVRNTHEFGRRDHPERQALAVAARLNEAAHVFLLGLPVIYSIQQSHWTSGGKSCDNKMLNGWRRRRDSNPRDGFPPTPLAGERLRPLGHVSADGPIVPHMGDTREKSGRAGYSGGVNASIREGTTLTLSGSSRSSSIRRGPVLAFCGPVKSCSLSGLRFALSSM